MDIDTHSIILHIHKSEEKTNTLDFFSWYLDSVYFTLCKTNYLGLKSRRTLSWVLRGLSWDEPIHTQICLAAQV